MHQPDEKELLNHLAFEVHWLVRAAIRFRTATGPDRVAFQDSAFLHARNLLELAAPKRAKFGWWIGDVGGAPPPADSKFQGWKKLFKGDPFRRGAASGSGLAYTPGF